MCLMLTLQKLVTKNVYGYLYKDCRTNLSAQATTIISVILGPVYRLYNVTFRGFYAYRFFTGRLVYV